MFDFGYTEGELTNGGTYQLHIDHDFGAGNPLEDFETWDAIQLAKWHKFEVGIRDIIREITSWDRIQEDIEEIIHEIRSRPRYASGVLS